MIVPGIPYVQGRNSYSDADGVKYGIAIHNTSNDASDEGEASYATWRTDGTSSHLYADDDSVTQSLDTAKKAGHAGSSTGNENAIAVEITGGNGMPRDWWLANVAWGKLGQVLAVIIRHHWPDGSFQVRRASVAEMKANPKIRAFYGHDDMRLAWGGTTHTDPGGNFPWDRLFAAVRAELAGAPTKSEEDDMLMLARDPQTGQHWLCDGMRRRPVAVGDVQHLKYLGATGALNLWTGTPGEAPGSIWQGVGDLMGLPITDAPAVDIEALAAAIVAKLPIGQPPPTAEQIADAVADEQADRLSN